MIKYITFDFDGTLADTFEIVKEEGNKILARYNIVIDAEEARRIGLKKTILKSGFPIPDISKCHAELRRNINARLITEVKTFPGINNVIQKISQHKTLIIVSSSPEESIKEVLKSNGLLPFFEIICSERSLFGKHRILKRLCKKHQIRRDEIVYIGDEDRDVQAAKRLKIRNIAVSWGYNTAERLSKTNPDVIVNEVHELLAVIRMLS